MKPAGLHEWGVKRIPVAELPADNTVRAALERFLREIRELAGDRIGSIVVFGSVARGEAHRDSDVDLLVVWDGSAWEAVKLMSRVSTPILIESGVDIVPHPVTPAQFEALRQHPSTFYQNVEREGLLVEG